MDNFSKESYDAIYTDSEGYKKHYSEVRYVNIWKYVTERLSLNDKILELGCGPGHLANMLYDNGFRNYTGIDFSEVAINLSKSKIPSFNFIESDLNNIKYDDYKDHKIISIETFEHVVNDIEIIKKLPDTNIIFSVPNYMCENHYRVYPSKEFIIDYYKDVLDIFNITTFVFNGDFFIKTEKIENKNVIFVVEAKIKTKPLINIITRASKKESVIRCINSVKNQVYKNIHHIITYETEEFGNFLKEHTDIKNTTLLKVVKQIKIPNLAREFWYYENIDIEKIEYNIADPKNIKSSWFAEPNGSGVSNNHFPYNLYLLKAEKHVKPGWVIYLDDNDMLYDNKSIEILVNNINIYSEDTLHLIYVVNNEGREMVFGGNTVNVIPTRGIIKALLRDTVPLGSVCGSCFCFHSKYLDYTAWSEWRGDDWKTLSSLSKEIKNKNLVEELPIIDISKHEKI